MPIVATLTIPERMSQLLRANPGREFSMSEISRELACDLSIVPRHARTLARNDLHVYYVVPASRGFGARVPLPAVALPSPAVPIVVNKRSREMIAQALRLLACAVECIDEPDDAPERPERKLDSARVSDDATRADLRRRGII